MTCSKENLLVSETRVKVSKKAFIKGKANLRIRKKVEEIVLLQIIILLEFLNKSFPISNKKHRNDWNVV